MKDANNRREVFEKNIPPAINWEYLDGYSQVHPELQYDESKIIRLNGRALTRGEIGCYSSHFAAWKILQDNENIDSIIVMEDDVIVDWEFIQKMNSESMKDFDYVRLYQKRATRFRTIKKGFIERTKSILELYGFPFGTQGYYLSRNGAARLIEIAREVVSPVDDLMDRSWEHGFPTYCLFPFPIIERSSPSEIGEERFKKIGENKGRRIFQKSFIHTKIKYYIGLLKFIIGTRR